MDEGPGVGNEASDFQVNFREPSLAGFTTHLAAMPELEETHLLKDMSPYIPFPLPPFLPHSYLLPSRKAVLMAALTE